MDYILERGGKCESDFYELAGAGIELVNMERREFRLRDGLASVVNDYDFIFIDSPPSLDLLTLNGLCACDTVLVPIPAYSTTEAFRIRFLVHGC